MSGHGLQKNIIAAIVLFELLASPASLAGIANGTLPCHDPFVQVVRSWQAQEGNGGQHREMVAKLPQLEAAEARSCRALSSAEENRLTSKKRIAVKARLAEFAQADEEGDGWVPRPDQLGITRGVRMQSPDGVFDEWRGLVDNDYYEVFAGYYKQAPKQGVVLVVYGGKPGQYRAPTATGPLKIEGEQDGVLTLRSVSGTYTIYNALGNAETTVHTTGHTVFKFDLRKRSFLSSGNSYAIP